MGRNLWNIYMIANIPKSTLGHYWDYLSLN